MKKLLIASAISLLGFTSTAFAMDFEQYVSAKAVLNHTNNKFELLGESDKESKNVGGFRLAYGVAYPVGDNKVRAELEYGYNGKVKFSDSDTIYDHKYELSSETKSQSLMANMYFDFNTGTAFTPYIGAGLGYARLKNTISGDISGQIKYSNSISKSSNNFAWNVGAGVSYAVNRDVDIDLSYRYADYGDVKHSYEGESLKVKQRGNEFNLGVRFNF